MMNISKQVSYIVCFSSILMGKLLAPLLAQRLCAFKILIDEINHRNERHRMGITVSGIVMVSYGDRR